MLPTQEPDGVIRAIVTSTVSRFRRRGVGIGVGVGDRFSAVAVVNRRCRRRGRERSVGREEMKESGYGGILRMG